MIPSTCSHIYILKATDYKEYKYEPHLTFNCVLCPGVKCTHRLISGRSLMFMHAVFALPSVPRVERVNQAKGKLQTGAILLHDNAHVHS